MYISHYYPDVEIMPGLATDIGSSNMNLKVRIQKLALLFFK